VKIFFYKAAEGRAGTTFPHSLWALIGDQSSILLLVLPVLVLAVILNEDDE
jgi:hypothetical protein